MKTYTFSDARQNLAELLNAAKSEEVLIRRRNGDTFVIRATRVEGSPFDVKPVQTGAGTADILSAIQTSRSRPTRQAR